MPELGKKNLKPEQVENTMEYLGQRNGKIYI